MAAPQDAPMTERDTPHTFSAERVKAFIDAVVAIAMTLLILPLMESVGEVGGPAQAGEWYAEHADQLVSFGSSFVLVGFFWIRHHQLFASVHRVTQPLLWLCLPWLAAIVWMPVATAITGQLESDAVARLSYIGTMVVEGLALLAMRRYLSGHPELHEITAREIFRGTCVDVGKVILLVLAAVVAVAVPSIGYFALMDLVLIPVVAGLLRRAFDRTGEMG